MGLPGSGKTTLASALNKLLENSCWYNGDQVRELFKNWDFSIEGRIRQAERMRYLADKSNFDGFDHVVCDFVAPTNQLRETFNPDILIWMDTISRGRYEDTNQIFEPPTTWDYRINEYDSEKWANIIASNLNQI